MLFVGAFVIPHGILTRLPVHTVLRDIQIRELSKPTVLEKVGHYFCCHEKEERRCVAEESTKEAEIFPV